MGSNFFFSISMNRYINKMQLVIIFLLSFYYIQNQSLFIIFFCFYFIVLLCAHLLLMPASMTNESISLIPNPFVLLKGIDMDLYSIHTYSCPAIMVELLSYCSLHCPMETMVPFWGRAYNWKTQGVAWFFFLMRIKEYFFSVLSFCLVRSELLIPFSWRVLSRRKNWILVASRKQSFTIPHNSCSRLTSVKKRRVLFILLK